MPIALTPVRPYRVAERRDERAHQLAEAAGQRLERAVGAGDRRSGRGVHGARKARSRLPCCALGLDEAREQRADRQPIDVAGVDAGEQRLGEIGRRFVAEAPAHERADRFVGVVASRAARRAPRPCAACPATRRGACATNGPTRVGMPSTDAAGSGCSRPPRWMYASRGGLVGTSRSPRPSSSHSAMPSGFWISSESGPPSIVKPSTSSLRMTPPARGARFEDDERHAAPRQLVGGRRAPRSRRRRRRRRPRQPPHGHEDAFTASPRTSDLRASR